MHTHIRVHTHTHACVRVHAGAHIPELTYMYNVMYVHTYTYVLTQMHTPILQTWFLQLGRETLAVFSGSAAAIDPSRSLRLVK